MAAGREARTYRNIGAATYRQADTANPLEREIRTAATALRAAVRKLGRQKLGENIRTVGDPNQEWM